MHLIIAGHGKQRNGTFDPGATGLIKKGEHRYVVEDLFPAMRKHLPNKHNLVFFSSHKVSNYGDIVSLARKYKAKQITEIHFDSAGAAASGGHVIIHSDYAPDKVDLALRDAINSMVGLANRTHRGHKGIHGRNDLINVNLTRNAKITYRLIELGYGASNKRDADILVNRVDDYAKALVKALVGDVKQVVNKSTSSKTSSNTKPTKPNNSAPSAQKSTYKLTVDGKWGTATTRALQRALGTPVDGIISNQLRNNVTTALYGNTVRFGRNGSPMIRALQRKVGVKVDGYLGPETVRKLQRYLGTPVDGVISRPSSLIVKEMQRRLNNGSF